MLMKIILRLIAKTWKQQNCSSTDGTDKENVVPVYDEILHSHKKKQNNPRCGSMNGPEDCHSK